MLNKISGYLAFCEIVCDREQHNLTQLKVGLDGCLDDQGVIIRGEVGTASAVALLKSLDPQVFQINHLAFTQPLERVKVQPFTGNRQEKIPHDLAIGRIVELVMVAGQFHDGPPGSTM